MDHFQEREQAEDTLINESASLADRGNEKTGLVRFLNSMANFPLNLVNGVVDTIREILGSLTQSFDGVKLLLIGSGVIIYLAIQVFQSSDPSFLFVSRCLTVFLILSTIYILISLGWMIYARHQGYDSTYYDEETEERKPNQVD